MIKSKKPNNDFTKKLLSFFCFFILSSCVNNSEIIHQKTIEITSPDGFKEKIYQNKYFPIFTLQKITDNTKPFRIYIEGDGRAFINKRTASSDPTPTSYFFN